MSERAAGGDWRSFGLLWLGQVVSLFGSGLTGFGLGVWVFERTGSVSDFTLIFVFGMLPGLLLGPVIGALVDRWDRRWVMIISDAVAAAATLALVALLRADALQLWQLYVIVAVGAASMTVQNPAFAATVPLLIPKKHLGRASGMMQLGPAASRILAPLAAGALMPFIGLPGIIAIDLSTFVFAALTLLLIRIPKVQTAPRGRMTWSGLLREAGYGWTYIRERAGLVDLLAFFAVINLLFSLSQVLTTPLVLSFSGTRQLGLVLALGSAGMLVGSLVMSAWGGTERKMGTILGFTPLLGLSFLLIGAAPSIPLIAAGVFLLFFVIPIVNAADQAIWQTKVEPAVQGRVFAMAQLLSQFTAPIAFLAAGPLADRVFEPLLRSGGALAGSVGAVIGSGPGRGIGLQFLLMGCLLFAAALVGLSLPRLRRLEEEIPDAIPEAPPAEAGPGIAPDQAAAAGT